MKARKAKRPFDELKERVWSQADLLATEASGGKFPVPVTSVAKSVGVESVVFDRFLSTAGLERKHVDRYVIWVNIIGKDWEGPPILATDTSVLPTLPSWARFIIAHELAHLIFIRASGTGFHLSDERASIVERACNEIARVILLPSRQINSAIGPSVFDVDHVAAIIDLAEVSPEVLLWRLPLTGSKGVFEGKDGAIAYAHDVGGRLGVLAYHVVRGGQAAARFTVPNDADKTDPLGVRVLERWGIDAELMTRLWQDEHTVAEREIPAGGDRVLPCVIQARRVRRHHRGVLISINVLGAPRRRGIFDTVNSGS